MAVLSVFLQKKDHDPLGVKPFVQMTHVKVTYKELFQTRYCTAQNIFPPIKIKSSKNIHALRYDNAIVSLLSRKKLNLTPRDLWIKI